MPVPSTKTDEFICNQEEDPYSEQPYPQIADLNTLLMMLNILFTSTRRRNLDYSSPHTNVSYSVIEINPTNGTQIPYLLIIQNRFHPEAFTMMNDSNLSSELISDTNQSLDDRANAHLVE